MSKVKNTLLTMQMNTKFCIEKDVKHVLMLVDSMYSNSSNINTLET